jgi:hypothetical protein
MRQILSRSVLTVAAAGSIIAVSGGYASADSDASGTASGSPGLLSGNSVSVPVEAPVNVCGNSVDGAAALNPAFGNACANGEAPQATKPPTVQTPAAPAPQAPPRQRAVPPQPAPQEVLAETGFGGGELSAAAAAATALLMGGALLYRRSFRTTPARAAHAHAGGAHAAHAAHARR